MGYLGKGCFEHLYYLLCIWGTDKYRWETWDVTISAIAGPVNMFL
jgi:hypothetical protein